MRALVALDDDGRSVGGHEGLGVVVASESVRDLAVRKGNAAPVQSSRQRQRHGAVERIDTRDERRQTARQCDPVLAVRRVGRCVVFDGSGGLAAGRPRDASPASARPSVDRAASASVAGCRRPERSPIPLDPAARHAGTPPVPPPAAAETRSKVRSRIDRKRAVSRRTGQLGQRRAEDTLPAGDILSPSCFLPRARRGARGPPASRLVSRTGVSRVRQRPPRRVRRGERRRRHGRARPASHHPHAERGQLAPERQACAFDRGRVARADDRHRVPGRGGHPHQPRHRDHAGEPLLQSLPRAAGRAGLLRGRGLPKAPAAKAARGRVRRLRLLPLRPARRTAAPDGRTPTATAARSSRTRTTSTASASTTAGAREHDDYDNGLLDHFVTQNNPDGQRTFFYEDDTVIPFYYALANNFAVGDRYFCSVLSSTWPNRYLPDGRNVVRHRGQLVRHARHGGQPGAANLLAPRGRAATRGRTTRTARTWWSFSRTFGLSADTRAHYARRQMRICSATSRTTRCPTSRSSWATRWTKTRTKGRRDLPGIGGQARRDDHPHALRVAGVEGHRRLHHVRRKRRHRRPRDARAGVSPGRLSRRTTGTAIRYARRLSIRPASACRSSSCRLTHARTSSSHRVYEHASITRFIETRFGLPALTARDANATPPLEMFDFQNPPFMTPPNITATTTVPPTILTQCNQALAPLSCGD